MAGRRALACGPERTDVSYRAAARRPSHRVGAERFAPRALGPAPSRPEGRNDPAGRSTGMYNAFASARAERPTGFMNSSRRIRPGCVSFSFCRLARRRNGLRTARRKKSSVIGGMSDVLISESGRTCRTSFFRTPRRAFSSAIGRPRRYLTRLRSAGPSCPSSSL
jgi:hypothetical protein